MPIIENQIVAFSKLSASQLFFRHLVITCDDKGNILKIPTAYYHRFTLLFQTLHTIKNIGELFDLPAFRTLDELPTEKDNFFIKPGRYLVEMLEGFHTDLSLGTLRLLKGPEKTYLGIITLSELIPYFYPQLPMGLLVVDQYDLVRGFNETFYGFFRDRYGTPGEILNKPTQVFMSPSPLQINQDRLAKLNPREALAGFTSTFFQRFKIGSPPDFFPAQEIAAMTAEGLVWENKGGSLTSVEFGPPADTAKSDLAVRVRFKCIQGQGVLICVGQKPTDTENPGYLAGPFPGTNKYILKKKGYILTAVDRKEPPDDFFEILFFKIGRAFYAFQEGRLLLAHYDAEFVPHSAASLSLALRPGGGVILQEVFVGRKPVPAQSGTPEPDDKVLVRLKDDKQSYFLLNRFFNPTLTSQPYIGYSGYMLQDVSSLQYKVEDLAQKFENEQRKGEILKSLLEARKDDPDGFIGNSPMIASVKEKGRVIAGSQATVLIQGPTGSGKEVLARHIHSQSPFRKGPFVKVDCSTLPRELMESELFGHEKGAFTGALSRKIGRMERASKGTLFLDEVANLTLEAQAKLLQFLQDFQITRLGGQNPITLSLRVIAASNIKLDELVRRGLFREDLYYRLYVVVLDLPALKERKEDLHELCLHFVRRFSLESRRTVELTAGAFRKLYAYEWPGNVRELKNVLQRAVLFCRDGELGEELIVFGDDIQASPERARPGRVQRVARPPDEPYHFLKRYPVQKMRETLKEAQGNITHTARKLGVTARGLYHYLKRNGVNPREFRTSGLTGDPL